MKVILDANIWFSYLLTPLDVGTIPLIIRHCAHTRIEVLIPDELAQEIRHTVVNTPYLSAQITYKDIETYLGLLFAEINHFLFLVRSCGQNPYCPLGRLTRSGPDRVELIDQAGVWQR